MLIDAGDAVRKSWQVPKALFGALPGNLGKELGYELRCAGRVTYVIGKDGKVKSIYDDLANATLHPEKALNAL